MILLGTSGSSESTSCGTISVLQTDKTQENYWYYGGIDSDGTYLINRYDADGLRGQAVGAWIDRYTLTYL